MTTAAQKTPAAKRTRKPKATSDPKRDAFMATARQSDAARLVGMDGSRFRDIARHVFNAYVSKGAAWDDALKSKVWAYVNATPAERAAIREAQRKA
jgi:hypothetical protein